MQDILNAIEAARRAGTLSNDAARAASVALGLTGDDAMLAVRILAQGSDPASIEYLATGAVSAPIALAHRNGPGSLTGADRDRWLNLAGLSVDESKGSTLRSRVLGMVEALNALPTGGFERIARKREEIASLPFKMGTVGGREMRVYQTDLGFAAAYWAGEPCAAVLGVYNGVPYLAVGSNGTPLASLGVTVGKPIAPCFGIIEDPAAVAAVSL
jgi:hypothetical protein